MLDINNHSLLEMYGNATLIYCSCAEVLPEFLFITSALNIQQ